MPRPSDNIPEALRVLQTVLLRDPAHLEALNNYGVTLMRQQLFANAITFFEKAIDTVTQPSSSRHHYPC